MAEDSCSLIVHGVHGVDRMRSDRYGLPLHLVFRGFVYPFALRIEGEGSVSFAIT